MRFVCVVFLATALLIQVRGNSNYAARPLFNCCLTVDKARRKNLKGKSVILLAK